MKNFSESNKLRAFPEYIGSNFRFLFFWIVENYYAESRPEKELLLPGGYGCFECNP